MAIHEGYGRGRKRKQRYFLPVIFDTLQELESEEPVGLLILAGLLRDEFPWISELLAEGYGDIRRGNNRAIERLLRNTQNLNRLLTRGLLIEEFGSPNDQIMLVKEIPIFLQRYLERFRFQRQELRVRPVTKKEETESAAD